jgi:hypothetical protein
MPIGIAPVVAAPVGEASLGTPRHRSLTLDTARRRTTNPSWVPSDTQNSLPARSFPTEIFI